MKEIFKIFNIIKYPYKKHIIIFILTIVAIIPNIVQPFIIKRIFDDAIPNGNLSILAKYAFLFVVINIIAYLLDILLSYTSAVFGPQLIYILRHKLLKKLLNSKLSFINNESSGEIISRLINDVDSIESFLLEEFPKIVKNILIVIVVIVILINFNWLLAILLIPITILFHFSYKINGKRIEQLSNNNQKLLAKFQVFFSESIGLFYLIKMLLLEKVKLNEHKMLTEKYISNRKKLILSFKVVEYLSELIPLISRTLMYGLGGYFVIKGEFSIGKLLAFQYLLSYLTDPLSSLFRINTTIRAVKPSINRIIEYIDIEQENSGSDYLKKITSIKFDKVTFRYETNNEFVINNLSFEICKNETIGIAGISGSGKTTIANLIYKFYEIDKGNILINDKNICEYNNHSVRERISFVPQDPMFFNATIISNLKIANRSACVDDVISACKLAHIDDFIMSLPNKYNTVVGERGVKLSGGQKQRLSIARAILKESDVIIFDEATSSLDTETEKHIKDSLYNLSNDKIIIIIAHRLSTIKECDMIFILDRGEIIEKGKHDTLIEKNGKYNMLWGNQIIKGK